MSLQVTFRHLASSESLTELAEKRLDRLRAIFPDATDCHVVVEQPNAEHHRKGVPFRAHVEITVGRSHARVTAEAHHESAYAAMRRAFDNVRRQIDHRIGRAG